MNTITTQDFQLLLATQEVMILDIRDKGAFNEGHLANSLSMPITTSSILPPQAHGFIKKIVRTRMRGIIINILRLSLLPSLKKQTKNKSQ